MPFEFPRQLSIAFRGWWREQSAERGTVRAAGLLVRELWEFLRDSTPQRRRRRYGDMDYDWEYRVNTTSGTVGWRERLLGTFRSAYQPTEPALFHEMMASLPIGREFTPPKSRVGSQEAPHRNSQAKSAFNNTAFNELTFVDLGSGKGRTLLMASEYPFRRIIGVEILPALHEAALENISRYKSPAQQCTAIEAIRADACEFEVPNEPLLVYLFNPLPRAALKRVVAKLEASVRAHPRPVYVIYLNPLLEEQLHVCDWLQPGTRTRQFATFVPGGSPAVEKSSGSASEPHLR